jgi:hypothetical protein
MYIHIHSLVIHFIRTLRTPRTHFIIFIYTSYALHIHIHVHVYTLHTHSMYIYTYILHTDFIYTLHALQYTSYALHRHVHFALLGLHVRYICVCSTCEIHSVHVNCKRYYRQTLLHAMTSYSLNEYSWTKESFVTVLVGYFVWVMVCDDAIYYRASLFRLGVALKGAGSSAFRAVCALPTVSWRHAARNVEKPGLFRATHNLIRHVQ